MNIVFLDGAKPGKRPAVLYQIKKRGTNYIELYDAPGKGKARQGKAFVFQT